MKTKWTKQYEFFSSFYDKIYFKDSFLLKVVINVWH